MVNHISIEMSKGDKILSENVLLGHTIELMGWELIVNLIMFEMPNFDMILGMKPFNRY